MRSKRFVSAALIVALTGAFMAIGAASASALSNEESAFVNLINKERRARGKSSLAVKSDLTSVARRHSARMASEGRIWHNPRLGSEVDGWTVVGENVGVGPSVESLHRAFMRSTSHRANILHSAYNQIGVGVVHDGDTIYVTEVFAKRGGQTRTVTRTTARRSSGTRVVTQAAPAPAPVAKPKPVKAPPRTVDVLLRIVGYDAENVDPATGQALGR